jgi:hypothetical protein
MNNGGPAFPQIDSRVVAALSTANSQGMTLRDYFAARAMQTLLGWDDDHANWRTYAEYAYQMADAMLEARKK